MTVADGLNIYQNDQDTNFLVFPSSLRFFKGYEKKLFRNLDLNTLKLEKKKSHLMFNETFYNELM